MNALHDPDRGTLEVVRPITRGRSFDVFLVRRSDTGELATARAPAWRATDGDEARVARLAALELEVAITALGSPLLTPAAEIWRVGDTREPVLVHPWIDGTRLDSWLAQADPGGPPVDRLLRIARGVADALAELHAAGFVHRCTSPEHVLVTSDDRVVLIGLGNASRRDAPACPAKATVDDAYSAPEIQQETSGRFNVPRADVYGFGMLLSFLATGQRPTGSVAAPFTRAAHARLEEGPIGIALIVAKCIQPLQKNRLSPMSRVATFLDRDALPTESTPGFGPLALLAPWGVANGIGLPVSHLSPGPLVDRPATAPRRSDEPATPADLAAGTDETELPPPTRRARVVAGVVSAVVLLLALYVTWRRLAG